MSPAGTLRPGMSPTMEILMTLNSQHKVMILYIVIYHNLTASKNSATLVTEIESTGMNYVEHIEIQ